MKKYTLLILLFFALKSFSQKEANIWYFGENAGLDFNTNPPTALTNGMLDTFEGCSSFSDADGNLLFYSDGITVYDKNHDLMKYTDGSLADNLKGDPSSTQSGMIIPKPGSSSIYYLFTVDDGPEYDRFGNKTEDGKGLNCYTIDMTLGGGIGQLIDENGDGVFYEDLSDGRFNNWEEKVAAVKGKTCDTYWVVSAVDNQFYSYLVDDTGIDSAPVISTVPTSAVRRGYLKISPDGTKLAITNQSDDFRNRAILYDFNNETGEVSISEIKLIDGIIGGLGEAYGVEFSPDSKKLYVSTTSAGRGNLFNPAVTYKLFQFDLIATDIPGSRELIHTQIPGSIDYPEGGYRGALQLGPDGKIYATIPLAYANGFAPFLDVIENPNASASDVIFTKNAIDLKGRFATQGLPPFISSLLLPIKIIDASGLPTNNVDLKTCIGSAKLITPEAITGITNDTYIWTFDNGTTVTEISNSTTQKSLNLTNIQTADTGTYKLKIEGKDGCGSPVQYNASFNLEVFEAASAKPTPDPIYFCDSDATVPNVFDFRKSSLSDKSKEILDGLSDTIFEVLYFDDPLKATDNVLGTNLPDDYEVNTPDEQTIYARVHNMSAPDTCYEITSFKLTVTGLPVAIEPAPYRACDTDISGPNFGYHDAFLLNTKDEAILGGPSGLNPKLYNISYHTTPLGAKTSDVATIIPKDIPYRNITKNNQEIFVRLENKADPTCFDASMSFNLVVDPLPIIKNNPIILEQCITTSDPNPTVNLTLSEVNISNTPNLTFEYYEDPTGTTLITTPTSYPVIANISQSVYVKVISDQGCSKDLVTLTINVGRTLDNPFNTLQPPVCDDFLDANGNDSATNSDTDFITNFSLDSISIVNSINPPINTKVFFYENQKDRTEAKNEIYITKYRNDISKIDITTITGGIQFPIYYKILSTINNDCQGLGQFYLQINQVPLNSSDRLPPIVECDDAEIDGNYINGVNENIDLTQVIGTNAGQIFEGTGQVVDDFDFFFFTSEAGAFSGDITNTDYINTPNQFKNSAPGYVIGDVVTQTIYVSIKNKNTECINPHTSFDVIINPTPITTTTILPVKVCDLGTLDGDTGNGYAQEIDISGTDIYVRDGRPAADVIITYHKNLIDLKDLTSDGVDKFNYDSDPTRVTINPVTKISEEILYIRIIDISSPSRCVFDQSRVTIIVNPEPTTEIIPNQSYCDDDSDGDDTNGIVQNINLDDLIRDILGPLQDPGDFNVTFHTDRLDLPDGKNALTTPHANSSSPDVQRIYVRVENKDTRCVNDDLFFDVIVNPLPSFIVMGEENIDDPQIVCLNDTPLVLEAENPGAIYTYQWTNEVGDNLGNNATLGVTTAGNYTVTATDKVNGCSRSRTIVVKESNIATLEESFITIIDEANTIGNTNTISVSIDTISNNLGPGAYQYALRNEDNSNRYPFSGFQDTPVFENLEGGIYTIIVNDKNGCLPDAELQISVIQFPKFFTPNGDGKNDTWSIKGANKSFYPNSSIDIYNRFGKLVAQIPIDSQGWDGTYNGTRLPSDDYWFRVQLIPANTNKIPITKKGHFSLLRR